MIQIAGIPFQPNETNGEDLERIIVKQLSDSPILYTYPSMHDLLFELKLRKNIIDSADEMNRSKAVFTTFQYATCNDTYWKLTDAGGFLLKRDVNPSEAILDIFKNSSKYAFECATACVIIFYRAVLKSIGKPFFDSLFQNIYLYSWHADPDLGIRTFHGKHFLPGDIVYFNNPDFNPETPWYRGVNAVVMTEGKYFGHGFGIKTDEEMIDMLNKKRNKDSSQSTYLTTLVTNPAFLYLSKFSNTLRAQPSGKRQPIVYHHNKSSISSLHYLSYLQKLFIH
ncbi:protein-glutamine gamma-glutamyltransferase [Bacillus pinisoli]|uniref:protein-glutamine gamma-glutamyltransferase n=1 Tax=Bacillus pinisoli TaxID=2901866 RepID=UPI001FF4C537|nr:protein-glutamine gamma-glutamyltransferase [Bacillus pinisoli]